MFPSRRPREADDSQALHPPKRAKATSQSTAPSVIASDYAYPGKLASPFSVTPFLPAQTYPQHMNAPSHNPLALSVGRPSNAPLVSDSSSDVVEISDAVAAANPWAQVNLVHSYDEQDERQYIKPAGNVEYHADFSDPFRLQLVRTERRRLFDMLAAKVNRDEIRELVILYVKLEPHLMKKPNGFKTMTSLSNPVENEEVNDWTCTGNYYLERNRVTIPLKQQLKALLEKMSKETYNMALSYLQQTNPFDCLEAKGNAKLTGPAKLAPVLGTNSPDALKKENNSMAPSLMGRKGWDLYHAQRKYRQFNKGGSNKAEAAGGGARSRRRRAAQQQSLPSPAVQSGSSLTPLDEDVKQQPQAIGHMAPQAGTHMALPATTHMVPQAATVHEWQSEQSYPFAAYEMGQSHHSAASANMGQQYLEESEQSYLDESFQREPMLMKWEHEGLLHIDGLGIYHYLDM